MQLQPVSIYENHMVFRPSRRAVLLTTVWVVGVGTSVAIAFAAVATVARGVEPSNAARLSTRAIDHELGAPQASSPSPSLPATQTSRPTTPATAATVAPVTTVPPLQPTTTAPPVRPVAPPAVAPTPPTSNGPSPTVSSRTTATASPGGTVWARCSAPDTIVFVAAVPSSGYQRVRDVENGQTVEQWFANGSKVSKIHAECADGAVHAEVDTEHEGRSGGD